MTIPLVSANHPPAVSIIAESGSAANARVRQAERPISRPQMAGLDRVDQASQFTHLLNLPPPMVDDPVSGDFLLACKTIRRK